MVRSVLKAPLIRGHQVSLSIKDFASTKEAIQVFDCLEQYSVFENGAGLMSGKLHVSWAVEGAHIRIEATIDFLPQIATILTIPRTSGLH